MVGVLGARRGVWLRRGHASLTHFRVLVPGAFEGYLLGTMTLPAFAFLFLAAWDAAQILTRACCPARVRVRRLTMFLTGISDLSPPE